jgi:P27 family predicted phage terminase small subunit
VGKRGPKPTPTAILKRRGTHRKDRTRGEPTPEGAAPPPPVWLLPEAKAEWARLEPELARMKLLTAVDWGQFAAYCQAFAHWKAAEEWMQQNGTVATFRDDKGNVKYMQAVPQMSIAHKSLELMKKFAAEFGLTPSARSRLNVGTVKDKDKGASGGNDLDKELGLI